jgi:RNA polymerase sigma-70 factor (ECF subfamily)
LGWREERVTEPHRRFPSAQPSDAELVEGARAGDSRAQEALYRRYVPFASGLAFRLLGSDKDLEDVVQDSFAVALRTLARLDHPQAFRAWFSTIVTGTAISAIRRRRLLVRIGLAHAAPVHLDTLIAPTAPPDVIAELRSVYGIIDTLPTRERVVLLLRRVEQLSLDEIAEQTGWSLATVKRALASATTALELRAASHGGAR